MATREQRPRVEQYEDNGPTTEWEDSVIIEGRPHSQPGSGSARVLLNPLFLYAMISVAVLSLYLASWSALYGPLDGTLTAFLVASVLVSLVAGGLLQTRINSLQAIRFAPAIDLRASWSITLAIVASFLAQFLIVGQIPFVDVVLNRTTADYGKFPQLPGFGVLLTTFAIFYSTVLSYRFTLAHGKAKFLLTAQFASIELMFLLLLSRGAMVLCLISAGILLFSRATFSLRRIVWASLIVVFAMYIFGGVGNLREGASFSDSEHIRYLAHLTRQYPDWIPHQFVWVYMYSVSPLGNLNYTVAHQLPLNDAASTFVNLVPDFATKRLFPDFNAQTPVVANYFNVSTGFASAWKFNGFLGLWVTFFSLVALVTLAARASKGEWALISLALSCGMVSFMFFHNTLSYSGVSFALVYPVLATLIGIPARGPRRPSRDASAVG